MVAKCREGIGEETFAHQLSSSVDKGDVLAALEKEYRLGYHKAAKVAEVMRRSDLWAVTSLEGSRLRDMGISPFASLQDAVDELLRRRSKAEVLVLLDASVTVPRVREDE